MTDKIEYCTTCYTNPMVYKLWYNNYQEKFCQECTDVLLRRLANKGIETFMGFLLNNTAGIEAAISVASQVFGEEEIKKTVDWLNEYIPMFTYGILKYPTNIEYEGGKSIVENAKVKGHIMFATNGKGFPVTKITRNDSDIVYGTYFEIPRHVVLCSYDLTEGYSADNSPEHNMYNRQIIDVILPNGETKQANMYIANEDWFKNTMIPAFQIMTGNFDDRFTHLRQILYEEGGEA